MYFAVAEGTNRGARDGTGRSLPRKGTSVGGQAQMYRIDCRRAGWLSPLRSQTTPKGHVYSSFKKINRPRCHTMWVWVSCARLGHRGTILACPAGMLGFLNPLRAGQRLHVVLHVCQMKELAALAASAFWVGSGSRGIFIPPAPIK